MSAFETRTRAARVPPTRFAMWAPVAAIAGLAAAALSVAGGVAGAEGRGPILHEDVDTPPEQARRTAERVGAILGPDPRPGTNPTAFARGSRILPRPEWGRGRGPGGGERGRGVSSDRDTEYRADRHTHADGSRDYTATFNPSVTPHKRMSALDAVSADYTLAIGAPGLRPVPVGGRADPDRDLFWASIRVDLEAGRDVPIPSVAPDMRILSYEVDPDVGIDFFADGADNFYVRAAAGGGAAHLVMLVDADANYFGAPIPGDLRVRDVDADRAHALPPGPRDRAREALYRLDVHPDDPLAHALDTLTEYFRSFDMGEMPPGSGDIYWDLFTSKLGVCRHRAFAFAITANALGIPTRYVQNEAHAFVEVEIPDIGWMRVDLGGAPLDLQVSEAPGTATHRPRHGDPFASPDSYEGSGFGSGGPRRTPAQPGDGAGEPARRAPAQPGDGAGEPAQRAPAQPGDGAGEPAQPGAETGDGRAAPGAGARGEPQGGDRAPDASEARAPEADDRAPLAIALTRADRESFRGENARVAGRVTSGGEGVADLRIEIYLAPAGDADAERTLVGRSMSGADGRFEATFPIPLGLELGDYEVFAQAPGSADYLPARSR